jgi:orotidine-5'-phosphate decarboxylase
MVERSATVQRRADDTTRANDGIIAAMTSTEPFAARLRRRIEQHGPLCVGIDPSAAILARCGLPQSAEGARRFGERVLEASDGLLAIVKPQSAYFEQFGSTGIAALEALIANARARGILVLLDAKRGDIDTTGEAYARGFFLPSSPLASDAVTISAYMGFGAMRKFVDIAAENAGGVFVVVRSSNPEGAATQAARLPNGLSVAEQLADEITAVNAALAPSVALGPVGAVVGATCADADAIVARMPRSLILAPGIGAQGADFADVPRRLPASLGRVLPSVSRAVLDAGTSVEAMRGAIAQLKSRARPLA